MIESVKNFNEEHIFQDDGPKLKDIDFTNWRDIKKMAKILREFAIGKRMDKLQRMLYSKELKEKEVDKEMKILLNELVSLETW
jgi:hypothetical protein